MRANHAIVAIVLASQAGSVCLAQSTIEPRQVLEPATRNLARFGQDVAVSGDWAIVSSVVANLDQSGEIVFFKKSSGIWSQQQQISAPSTAGGPSVAFGASVAIDGDVAVVGAPSTDPYDRTNAGRVLIYTLSNGEWGLAQSINGVSSSDGFGGDVDVHEGVIAVGAPGSFYNGENFGEVFVYSDPDNNESWTLLGSSIRATSISGARELGSSVSLSRNSSDELILAAGAPDSLQVFTYKYGTSWSSTGIVSALSSQFGHAVSLDEGRLAVGAIQGSGTGSAFIFDWNSTSWTNTATLSNSLAGTRYGVDVALSGDLLLVGAEEADFTETNNGAVYEYRLSGGSWGLVRNYVFYEGGTLLGHSVAISGNDVIAGGVGYNDPSHSSVFGSQDGVACVFNTTDCAAADLNSDGVLNEDDVYEFLDLYANNDPAADWYPDGSFNFFDVSFFLDDYNEGC